ncbi:MAG: nitroreductase family protein, partial [Candidatus Omnitrophica bacterium]|nr:nitroreductase family protein [Candidatus Omnitrophota bacterium]
MDILEIIRNRRSVRQFKRKPVPKNIIKKILEAGRWAPSGLNNQPWRFLIIKNKTSLAKFLEEEFNIHQVPVLILVLLEQNSSYHREKDLMAMGACIQNMCLQAHSLEIGSCW